MPTAPNGGWTVLQALAILERFDLDTLGSSSAEATQLVAEALRLAFADRYHHLGDPDFARVPIDGLLSDGYADELAALARTQRSATMLRESDAQPWQAFAFEPLNHPWRHDPAGPAAVGSYDVGHGTTHLCAIDAEGRSVSCTITAGNSFGSKVVARGTGVLFDSAMAWFNPLPGAVNSIAPGKRPLVNMAPLVASRTRGGALAVGASGGRRIISAVTQILVNAIDHGMSVDEAIDAPRLDASERVLRVSDRLSPAVDEHLAALGYETERISEEHQPYLFELSHPGMAAIDASGARSGAINAPSSGFVAGC